MCCCGKPTINGEQGYRWNEPAGPTSVYPVNPPDLGEHDTLVWDEPGRCGGLDSHSHHYRVVKSLASVYLLVRHGGGDERVYLSPTIMRPLSLVDSTARYWILNTIYHAQANAARDARDKESFKWRMAIAEKRVKTNRRRIRGMYPKVWIVEKVPSAAI